MLVLFDVDATLITTSRAGIEAMGRAGRAMFGDDFDENRIEYAGRLDPLIIADLLGAHGRPTGLDDVESFRRAYGEHLGRVLQGGGAAPCPGVPELLDALDALHDGPLLGLLTGNFPETGRIKLTAAGVDVERFNIHVWGCDSPHTPPHRSHLPLVALERFRAHAGREAPPEHVTIIGDTPHDVRCGKDNDMRVLGVATGQYSRDELDAAGADLAVDNLSDTEAMVRWLTSAR